MPFEQRGKIMDEYLDILKRFWTEHTVSGKFRNHDIPAGVMFPKPVQKPHPPILIGGYVDRVLQRAAVAGDGWLTYFYRPESFAKSWGKICDFAKAAGKDPDKLLNAAQLPIYIGKSRQEVERGMMEWLTKEWDFAAWSKLTKESAIMGMVDECVEQLKEHLAVGTQKLIFVPYKYEMQQIETIAREIIPGCQSKLDRIPPWDTKNCVCRTDCGEIGLPRHSLLMLSSRPRTTDAGRRTRTCARTGARLARGACMDAPITPDGLCSCEDGSCRSHNGGKT